MELNPVQIRILGCLMEKEKTTPDNYPLSTNALVNACNQSSNRDPVVSYDERTVVTTMTELRTEGLARTIISGRTDKHRQILAEAWDLNEAQMAVMAILMLRGPQTVGEIRTRTNRMYTFDTVEQVEETLDRLADRPEGFITQLERQPGTRGRRWTHTIGLHTELVVDPAPVASSARSAPITIPSGFRGFKQVDVFTSEPYRGNPVAVVMDGDGLGDEEMQNLAKWTNLSETTFVLPPTSPEADYRVRIFTPGAELPFAGHPTLGTCHAWLESGGKPASASEIVQECGVGLVRLRTDGTRLAFAAPALIRGGPVDHADLELACRVLDIEMTDVVDAQWADNGPGWLAVMLEDAESVLAVEPDFGAVESYDIGVVGPHDGDGFAIEVRAFFRSGGQAAEDPVTGSLNAALAQWLLGDGTLSTPYIASQGTALGRAGRVYVDQSDGEIWVGGDSITCIDGAIAI